MAIFLLTLLKGNVMNIHLLIRRLRIKQGVKQSEIAKGIMDTSAYSRFERGERALTSTELELIMCRLNAHITDLSDIENMENAVAAKIRELTQKSITNEVDLDELKELYEIAKAEKDQSLRSYRSFLYIKHQFEQTAPFIEPITSAEMDRLFDQIQSKNYLTNYYLQLIADFTPKFKIDHLKFFLETLKDYEVDHISSIDCQYLHVLPAAISNITDSLIDHAVLDKTNIDFELLAKAEESCDKLEEILSSRPVFNFSLLFTLFRIRIEYYKALTSGEKEVAIKKAINYKKDIEFIVNLKDYHGEKIRTTADIALYSLNNLITSGTPGAVAYFID